MPNNLELTHKIELTKKEFDAFFKAHLFVVGPVVETVGDGRYDPYIPDRRAFGTLFDGRKVWAWVIGGGGGE